MLVMVTSAGPVACFEMVECRRRPDLPWCSDADADASGHKTIDGVPCRQVLGCGRSIY
jgi:hypothetical protein